MFGQSISKLKKNVNSVNTVDNEICCISSAINELCLIRDGMLGADWPMIDNCEFLHLCALLSNINFHVHCFVVFLCNVYTRKPLCTYIVLYNSMNK